MNKLTKLYAAILEGLDLNVKDDGVVVFSKGKIEQPVGVDGKVLALPTKDVLANADWDEVVAFHPLSENIVRGESPVLKKLRTLMAGRIHRIVNELAANLMTIAADTDLHGSLSPDQSELLSNLKDADEKMLNALVKIIKNTSITGSNRVINLFIKRKGKLGDNTYARVCFLHTPILDESVGEDGTIYGVKLRKKDLTGIKEVYKYIFGDEEYSTGSDSKYAPRLLSLLRTYVKIMKRLNTIIKRFEFTGTRKKEPLLTDVEDLYTDVSWESHLDSLVEWRELIPNLDGNDGTIENEVTADETPVKTVTLPKRSNSVPNSQSTNQPNRSNVPVYKAPTPMYGSYNNVPPVQPNQHRVPVYARGGQPQNMGWQRPPQGGYGGYGGNRGYGGV